MKYKFKKYLCLGQITFLMPFVCGAQDFDKRSLNFVTCAGKGDFATAKAVLDSFPDINAFCFGTGGNVALTWVAAQGYLDLVKYLVDEKGADIMQTNRAGTNAFGTATENGQMAVVEYFVQEKKVPVNDIMDKNNALGGVTVPEIAVLNNQLDIVRYLKKHGAVFNHVNEIGENLLMLLVDAPNIDFQTVTYLVDTVGLDVNKTDTMKQNALMRAVRKCGIDFRIIEYFATKTFDLEAKNIFGQTVMDIAHEYKNYFIEKYLNTVADERKTVRNKQGVEDSLQLRSALKQKEQNIDTLVTGRMHNFCK